MSASSANDMSVCEHKVIHPHYRVTTINVSRIWMEWAEWAALSCTANSPFPGQVYCRHPVQVQTLWVDVHQVKIASTIWLNLLHLSDPWSMSPDPDHDALTFLPSQLGIYAMTYPRVTSSTMPTYFYLSTKLRHRNASIFFCEVAWLRKASLPRRCSCV